MRIFRHLLAWLTTHALNSMAYFNHICLVEAPQTIIIPFPRFITDCIGVCYLAAAVQHDVESLVMPDNFYNYCTGAVYKNGALYKSMKGQTIGGNYSEESLSFPMYFNGTTDYMEAYSYIETNVGYIYPMSCFSAIFIRGI